MKTLIKTLTGLLLCLPLFLRAQIPSGFVNTTATVAALANGQFSASWTNLSSSPQLGLLGCVSTFQTTVNGRFDSFGHFAFPLADTAQICPTPSTWTFTFTFSCSAGSTPSAFHIQVPITGGGGTEDISAQITAGLPPVQCSGGGGGGGGGGNPSPPAFAVQFANFGVSSFQADSTFTFNPTTHTLTSLNMVASLNASLSPYSFGAKCDGRSGTDGVTNSTTTFTSVTGNFTAADVGKVINVATRTAQNGFLVVGSTTVSAVSSSTSLTMSNAATGTGTGNLWWIGTNDQTALQNWINAGVATFRDLQLPAGNCGFSGSLIEDISSYATASGITPPNVPSIHGYGAGSSILTMIGDNTNAGLEFKGFNSWQHGSWNDFSINNQRTQTVPYGLYYLNVANWTQSSVNVNGLVNGAAGMQDAILVENINWLHIVGGGAWQTQNGLHSVGKASTGCQNADLTMTGWTALNNFDSPYGANVLVDLNDSSCAPVYGSMGALHIIGGSLQGSGVAEHSGYSFDGYTGNGPIELINVDVSSDIRWNSGLSTFPVKKGMMHISGGNSEHIVAGNYSIGDKITNTHVVGTTNPTTGNVTPIVLSANTFGEYVSGITVSFPNGSTYVDNQSSGTTNTIQNIFSLGGVHAPLGLWAAPNGTVSINSTTLFNSSGQLVAPLAVSSLGAALILRDSSGLACVVLGSTAAAPTYSAGVVTFPSDGSHNGGSLRCSDAVGDIYEQSVNVNGTPTVSQNFTVSTVGTTGVWRRQDRITGQMTTNQGTVALVLTGSTGTITGTALTSTCDSGTATVTGAGAGMPVAVSSTSGADVGGAFYLRGSVTSSNTVTVYVCGTGTPASLAYNVRVFP